MSNLVERAEYKFSPILILRRHENDRFPFQFGLDKARLIIKHYDEIRKFVAEEGGKQ